MFSASSRDALSVADPAFRQGGPKKMKTMNGLSIGCKAATARVPRAGGGFWRGCPPPIRFFLILVCLKRLFSSSFLRFMFKKRQFIFKSHQKDKKKN